MSFLSRVQSYLTSAMFVKWLFFTVILSCLPIIATVAWIWIETGTMFPVRFFARGDLLIVAVVTSSNAIAVLLETEKVAKVWKIGITGGCILVIFGAASLFLNTSTTYPYSSIDQAWRAVSLSFSLLAMSLVAGGGSLFLVDQI